MKRHGMRKTRFYTIWARMKQRCLDKNDQAYSRYGGRGITLYVPWIEFRNFKNDMLPSYIVHNTNYGEKNTTIDRINNNGNYEPKNCRWATYSEQAKNMRTNKIIEYKGKKYILKDLARKFNIDYHCLYKRLQLNWSLKEALFIKSKKGNNQTLRSN
jgi:hypothetical protein